ncbi:MAG: C40 family peptidase, partial [Clostridia bacterium]|nr:C40 family peptidase [Clostridia bacterium]
FDCSGFVYYVLNHFGIKVPTGTDAWNASPSSYGTVISISEVEKGDVLLWSGHIGFYSENGNCINAANGNEGVVEKPWTYYGSNPKVIRVNGVGIDNNTYNALCRIKNEVPEPELFYLVSDNDFAFVEIKGRDMRIRIKSDSIKDGKIYNEYEGVGYPQKCALDICDFSLTDNNWDYSEYGDGKRKTLVVNKDEHIFRFCIFGPKPAKKGYFDLSDYEFCLDHVTDYSGKDSTRRISQSTLIFRYNDFDNRPNEDNTLNGLNISYDNDAIDFTFSIPERIFDRQIVFNNKKIQFCPKCDGVRWDLGATPETEERTFFDTLIDVFNGIVENTKNTIITIVDAIKKAFSAMFGN